MDWFLVNAINALTFGLLLFLLSSGLTVAFGLMGVLSFAHGALYALGAYLGSQIAQVAGFWTALCVAPFAVGVFGVAIERLVLQRVRARGHLPELLATCGIGYVISEAITLVWGRNVLDAYTPAAWAQTNWSVLGVQIGATRAASVAIALGVLIVLAIVLRATRVGLVLRAALSNPAMVGALGVPLPRVHALVFGASCALAGLAGVLGGNLFVIEPAMAASVTGLAFVIIVIGGLGSLSGALIASLAVAAVQVFSAASTASVAGIDIARLAGALPYLLMVLVLALRPMGLAGDRE